MWVGGQWSIAIGFIRTLRIGFGALEAYRWDPDPQKSKVHIYESFPLQGLRYPAILVTVQGGPAYQRGIGDEFAQDKGTEVSLRGASYTITNTTVYSGTLALSVTLDIRARSGYERAQIADWCMMFLRHFFTDKLEREGVLIQDIAMGPQTQILLGADSVFGATLTVRCLSAWQRELNVALVQTLVALSITGVFSTLPDGTTIA